MGVYVLGIVDGTGSRRVGGVQEIHDVVDRGVGDALGGVQEPTLPEEVRLFIERLGRLIREVILLALT